MTQKVNLKGVRLCADQSVGVEEGRDIPCVLLLWFSLIPKVEGPSSKGLNGVGLEKKIYIFSSI